MSQQRRWLLRNSPQTCRTIAVFTFPDIRTKVDAPPPAVVPTHLSPLVEQIEVFVLTHGAKPSVTTATLTALHVPYTVYTNPDWDWPADHPELKTDRALRPSVRGYALRQFRAFRGHQEIMALAHKDKFTLVFEDDAALMPDTTPAEVITQLNAAGGFISNMQYDAVSFHAREQSPPKRSIALFGREYVELSLITQGGWGHQFFLQPAAAHYGGQYAGHLYRWHEGCLAYMVGPTARTKWLAAGHGHGMPCDLFLANELNTIVMRHTIFAHDHRHGSLIANQGTSAQPLRDDGTPIG